jgi:hypothetical protein
MSELTDKLVLPIITFGAKMGDSLTTYYALKSGEFYEINPVGDFLFSKIGLVEGLALTNIIYSGIFLGVGLSGYVYFKKKTSKCFANNFYNTLQIVGSTLAGIITGFNLAAILS